MNKYVAFYNGKQIEVKADTLWSAKKEAVKLFEVKPSKEHMVSVVLAEKHGEPVVHVADF